MKIAFICTEKLPIPSVSGGAVQQYIEGILPYLSLHHEITVYSICYPNLLDYEIIDGIKYVRIPGGKRELFINNLLNNIENDFELIHIFNRPQWVLNIAERFPNTKLSLSLHNEMFHPEKISAKNAVKCIERVEFINTVSKFILESVKKNYPSSQGKIKVIYSASDPNKYETQWSSKGIQNKHTLKRKYNIENYKVILYVGRLSPKKGTHILMKSMHEVMNLRRDTALVIIGSKWYGENRIDDYTKSLQALARDMPGPVIFTGFLPPVEIAKYYNLGDIFVCASQWNEPLARVHYEAMAAGLPIITTNRGGNSEVIYGFNNGIIINEYNNPSHFSYYINYLLSSPSSALQMGQNGRKLVEEQFNYKRVSMELLEEFNSLK